MNLKRSLTLAAFLAIVSVLAFPAISSGSVFVSVAIAPPVLPVYAQPLCPGPDYIWMPGYWGYGPGGYFWIPGTWVLAPEPGLLWTPGYWGFANGLYVWHAGYWGPHVGFYGGVDYGFGYFGTGFVGGMWEGGHFRYNTAVMHVNPAVVHNVYVDRTVIHNTANRASFNGPGGITARPTAAEAAAEHDRHVSPTSVQTTHERNAEANRNNFASVNHGRPAVMATTRPTAQPDNRAATNRTETAKPPSAVNRPVPANHPQQTRPPAAENRPAPVNRPQANHPEPARPPAAQSRPAPVNRKEPARPPVAANRPAPQSHPAPANRPAPQHSAPPKQAPAEQHEERR